MLRVAFSKRADKTLVGLDKAIRERIEKAIGKIPEGDIKPLKNAESTHRLRVGDWRILFSYLDAGAILIERISPRGDAYKGV